MEATPYIIDTTLRDGGQAPGVVFYINEKLRIADLLDKIGIPELELGTPGMGKNEIKEIKIITEYGFNFKTLAWCRAMKTDIDEAVKSGTDGVNISFPVSDIHLLAMVKDQIWVIETLRDLAKYASDRFEYFTIGLQDATRTEINFLSDIIGEAFIAGASRIRIADTVGIMNPMSIAKLFNNIKNLYPLGNFEFHGHNDLGMATANTITALLSGADAASVTVNGIGERAGNAALEEVLMSIVHSTDLKHKLNTVHLSQLSQIVSNASGIAIPVNKPVSGYKSLSHESGIHTNLLMKDRKTYQIIEASSIGNMEKKFVFGIHTGKAALNLFIEENSMNIPSFEIPDILDKIRRYSLKLKRELNEGEVMELVIPSNNKFSDR